MTDDKPKSERHVPKRAGALAENLRRRRSETKQSQRTIEHLTGLDQKSISEIEQGRGNPTLYTLERLADAVDLELEELIAQRLPLQKR
ncbi:MAG: hypothetical protein NVS1B6_01530 [Steroidobacteraceae bacterium]